jgi:hypothetical protein
MISIYDNAAEEGAKPTSSQSTGEALQPEDRFYQSLFVEWVLSENFQQLID